MAQIAYRATLSNAMWPQLARRQGRTVISPQSESLSSRKAELPAPEERDIISPQIYYLENVLPSAYGLDSVGFSQSDPAISGLRSDEQILNCVKLAATGLTQVLVAVTNYGEIYLLRQNEHTWVKSAVSSAHTKANTYNITGAVVNNRVFVHIFGVNRYEYNISGLDLQAVTFTGLETTPLTGISTSGNYLLAWDDDTVYWGALENPTDFTPSEITGAGNGVVIAAKGRIIACVPITLGYIIYCEHNAISALATSRADEPFTLREISASGGLANVKQISPDWNSLIHYAFTTSGLQMLSTTDAKPFIADFTDMITSQTIDYLDISGNLTTESWETGADVIVSVVKDRYVCISYKSKTATYFQWCLVYDLYLKRAGKLRRDHIEIIDYYDNIGFLHPDGRMEVVRLGIGSGFVVLGKFQQLRQRMIALDSVELDRDITGDALVTAYPSLDGVSPTPPKSGIRNPGDTKYYFSCVGQNISVGIYGRFSLDTVILHYHNHGRS